MYIYRIQVWVCVYRVRVHGYVYIGYKCMGMCICAYRVQVHGYVHVCIYVGTSACMCI